MASTRKSYYASGGKLLGLLAGLLAGPAALAAIAIEPVQLSQVQTWAFGDVVISQDFCVVSVDEPQPSGTSVVPYSVEVSGPFALENGGQSIAGTTQWQDLLDGSVETLAPDSPTATSHNGKIENCPGGYNGRLILRFDQAAVLSVPPDVYKQQFFITVRNAGRGRAQAVAQYFFELTVPDSVRISQLDDIDLGTFAGTEMTGGDSLCVFRASGLGYTIIARGEGASGEFVLQNGGSQVPFQAAWNDGTGSVALLPGSPLTGRTNAVAGSPSCDGGASNNAWLSIRVSAADILADGVPAGPYSGTLTLMLEMQ